MTKTTSTNNRNHRFLKFRCSFFSIEYTSERISENISKNSVHVEKIVRKNSECDRKNRLRFGMKCSKKINHAKELCKKSNENSTKDMDRKFKIVEGIIRIGSALSGLLPPIHMKLVKTVMTTS